MDDDLLDSHPDLMDPEWRKHARTDAWLGAKKDRKQLRKQRKRGARKPHRRWWILGVLVAILAVTTTAIVLVGRRPAQNAAPNPTRVPQYARVDLARPYANTPADTWPKGLDGITAPAAAAIGGFKADAVADAYAKVRQVIAVARLDPAVLYQHDPKAYLALFAMDARATISGDLGRKPSKDGQADVSTYLTEIADGHHLLDQGPRSFGSLTARAGERPGELIVDAKFSLAYAFDAAQPEQLSSPGQIVSFLRADESYVIRRNTGFPHGDGLWPYSGSSAYSSVGCAAAREGFLAPGYANPPSGPSTGDDQDAPGYYDPKYPVPTLDGCH
ncbi:hypothetical protein AB0M83_15120 [Amycolatopsis sp. NPDC051106]|uniref:hypothetical protein n=1 Tax=unclassified Amycolatopsis TaxID=2618356 RepID=UPI00341CD18A